MILERKRYTLRVPRDKLEEWEFYEQYLKDQKIIINNKLWELIQNDIDSLLAKEAIILGIKLKKEKKE